MLLLKNQIIILFFVGFFFNSFFSLAQEHNQYDKNNKRTGVWRKYYSNKRIRYIGQFKDGKEIGTFKYYDILSSEHPTSIIEYKEDSDLAEVKFYTTKGELKSKGIMYKRNRVGDWIYYYPDGSLFSEEFYIDGKLDGEVKNYYKNGNLFELSVYKNGIREGVLKRYSDKGILLEEVIYKNGKLNGEAKYYELNGDLKERGIYKDNLRIGKWDYYLKGELADIKMKKEANKFDKSILKKNDSVKKNN